MTPDEKNAVTNLLAQHRLMALATNRSDGWPQVTIVGYVHEGLDIYCYVARLSQKYANIARDPRVSVAIGADFNEPSAIKGLSLAGHARAVVDGEEYRRISALFLERFPEYARWPAPDPAMAPLLYITPNIISLIDYSKGFGHSQLLHATTPPSSGPRSLFHNWFGRGGPA